VRTVVNDITGFSWCQNSVIICGAILDLGIDKFEFLIESTQNSFTASYLMKIRPYTRHVSLVHHLSNHTIDVKSCGEESVKFGRACKKLSHYYKIRVVASSHLEHILADMNWR